MARRRRRSTETPPLLSGAGLLRFFEEETRGLKVPPIGVIAFTLILITSVILAHLLFPL
ncbi:MAG: preprotein translocase subunit Sec61beta [Thermoprotei archaeon]|nr:MAG: preprotein translocase subunit Sec61beta [Thermoprotei archaeon]RLF00591.1 MAG: preprotein translocase subunit Sec61beta [Thermoprotei archaeon]HDI74344.1 preprotein translocase subunit Sec61beta [Thermoprotei archaeon]